MTEISPEADEVSVSQGVNLPFEAMQMRQPGQPGQTCIPYTMLGSFQTKAYLQPAFNLIYHVTFVSYGLNFVSY